MGGVGSAIGMFAGTIVGAIYSAITKVEISNANENLTFPYVFLTGAFVMVIGMLVLLFFVKEPSSKLEAIAAQNQAMDAAAKAAAEKEARKAEKAARKAQKLSKGERTSLIFMLAGLFFLFCGTNAITTFFALFAAEVLNKTTAEATIMTTLFAVCSAIAAIPAGYMGKKLGRKKTILIGLALFMAVFGVYVVTRSMALIWVALVFGGFANMLITVNTLPLVLEIGGNDKVGTFTGYYYTATFSAQIASPSFTVSSVCFRAHICHCSFTARLCLLSAFSASSLSSTARLSPMRSSRQQRKLTRINQLSSAESVCGDSAVPQTVLAQSYILL